MGCESYHTQYRVVKIYRWSKTKCSLSWSKSVKFVKALNLSWNYIGQIGIRHFVRSPRGLKRTEKQNHLELFGAGRIPSLSYWVSNAHSLYEVSSTVATFGMLGASPLEFPRRDPCERLQWVHCWNWTFRLDVSWDSEDSYYEPNLEWKWIQVY